MNEKKTFEKYCEEMAVCFETKPIELGTWASHDYISDPKHIMFALSRYKFVSRLLRNVNGRVLEVGCGDGFGLPIVSKEVKEVIVADWDERNINGIKNRMHFLKNISCETIDFNKEEWVGDKEKVQAIYMIDVLEHIDPVNEDTFIRNVLTSFEEKNTAIFIVGTPNITASQYASPGSAALHINLKSFKTLNTTMNKYFNTVFLFGMNDEVIHTGYDAMCHYIWAVGVGVK